MSLYFIRTVFAPHQYGAEQNVIAFVY